MTIARSDIEIINAALAATAAGEFNRRHRCRREFVRKTIALVQAIRKSPATEVVENIVGTVAVIAFAAGVAGWGEVINYIVR